MGRNQFAVNAAVDQLDERADHASEHLSMLEGKMADMEEGHQELLALGREQTENLVQVCRAIMVLSTIMTVQQDQVTALRARVVQAEERLDVMQEMILALEHIQENPIVVDDDEETVVSNGEEVEIEENEVAIPIPIPGVRICNPTTQSCSRAEPKDPICSLYLSLLHFQPVPAPHLDFSPPYYISLYITSSLPFTR